MRLLALLVLTGCAGGNASDGGPEEPVLPPRFEFSERYGLDCLMHGACAAGYVVEGGWLHAYEDDGRSGRVWTDSSAFGAADWRALDVVLHDARFFEAPPQVPPAPVPAGGRTLTLRHVSWAGGEIREVIIHFNAQVPLPEWAYALEAGLRQLFQERLSPQP